MDKPICCRHYKDTNHGDPDKLGLDLHQRLEIALFNDNKAAFMTLIKDPGFEQERKHFTVDIIFEHDALEIARAILDGEAEGLIDNKLKDGMTPLRFATIRFAPRLTNYFLQNSGPVDDTASIPLSASIICTSSKQTIFNVLWRLCAHFRDHMEIVRMFVQSDEQRKWAREAVLNYAKHGEMPKIVVLFLAAPELFTNSPERGELSSLLCELNHQLNFSELGTHNTKKQLSMLLDLFALVGHKLATYIRLEEFVPKSNTKEEIEQLMQEIESFLREAVIKKHGHLDVDYYFSFFEDGERKLVVVGERNSDDDDDDDYLRRAQVWDQVISKLVGNDIYTSLPIILQGTGVKRHKLINLIPTLVDQNPVRAANLNRALGVSALHNYEKLDQA